ncbi:response regulator transcription factor [Arthrobacter sp. 24S4-2]|uniref:LuxR C-terminal-related transcriptional regulator n=1 Tax=Arthrobacter sp. 24S4-2 TaxID=2575374 RepID=UPI0020C82989|nr:response regulator transcription factor [Arthrobacter sp. 24S4-2]
MNSCVGASAVSWNRRVSPCRAKAHPREAVRRIPALRPQLAILDENLPDGTGTAVCRALRTADPSIRCLILSDTPQESTLIDAILSDAWGCLSKQDDITEQLRLIRRVLNGCTAFSEKFQALLNQGTLSLPEPPPSTELSILTDQEMNVVIGLGRGLTNRQIAQSLGLKEKTIKNLVSSALGKLGLARRTQAAVLVTTVTTPEQRATGNGQRATTAPYGHNRTPEALSRVTSTLLDCTKESTTPVDDAARAKAASALASALTRTRTTRKPHLQPAGSTRGTAATVGSLPITSEGQYPLISPGQPYHGTASRRVFVP